MAVDPLKNLPINRGEQLKIEAPSQEKGKGVRLYDVDMAIAEHMIDTVVPSVEIFREKVKVPVMYGNPERWKAIQKDGYLRDKKGQLQIPLIMFKRNSIERDEAMSSTMNRHVSYPSVSRYSKKHRYDRFSAMSGTQKPVEVFDVVMPDYVTISYEVMIWTDFTEHMNKIVEAFQYATDEYWGDKSGFKFRVKVDSFDNTTEVGEGSQRIVRTTFTMLVNAYLLPEQFNNESTHKKSLTPKKVVWGMETDLTGLSGGNVTNSSVKKQLINEYADIIDFMSIRGSKQATFVDADSFKLQNVDLPKLPPELDGVFNTDDWFRIYINGVFVANTKYTYEEINNEIYFNFSTGSLDGDGNLISNTTDLGYVLENTDEFGITGKFIEE
jgi:hypothetical protein|tara:strand:- start:7070 stop:8218 length:1149 start_codon:yes stop_codon:yes gene_type:complete